MGRVKRQPHYASPGPIRLSPEGSVQTHSGASGEESPRSTASLENKPRLIRIGVRQVPSGWNVYELDDADGLRLDGLNNSLQFGGCLSTSSSSIFLSSPRDLIYIDEPLPMSTLIYYDATRTRSERRASPMSRIVLNLSRIPLHHITPLSQALGNPELSDVIFICESDALRAHAANDISDALGFRYIPEEIVLKIEPAACWKRLVAMGCFSLDSDLKVTHRFAIDWGKEL